MPDQEKVDVDSLFDHHIIHGGDREGPLHRIAQNLAWYRDHAGVNIQG